MVVRDGRAGSLVLPVGIVERIAVGIEVAAVVEPVGTVERPVVAVVFVLVLQTLHEGVAPLLGVEHVHLAGHGTDAERALIAHLGAGFTLETALGGHHDDTVGTAGTVDGGSRSVLEYFHRFNVVRVDQREVGHHHTVDHIERVGAGIDGRHTADNHTGCRGAQVVRVGEHVDTSGLTAKVVESREVLILCQFFALGHGDGTCDVALAHGTVTHNDHLVKRGIVGLQGHLQRGSARERHHLVLISDEGDLYFVAGLGIESKLTVEVSGTTGLVRQQQNAGARHRLALLINDCH